MLCVTVKSLVPEIGEITKLKINPLQIQLPQKRKIKYDEHMLSVEWLISKKKKMEGIVTREPWVAEHREHTTFFFSFACIIFFKGKSNFLFLKNLVLLN